MIFFLYTDRASAELSVEKTHTVVKGDTLWGISEKYLGNPFLWPKLWQWNDFITNPHFIYPGNEITLYPPAVRVRRPEPVEEVIPEPVEVEEEVEVEAEAEAVVEAPPAPEPEKYRFSQIKSSGLISNEEMNTVGNIIDAKDTKVMLSEGDVVYVALNDSVDAGALYTIFKAGSSVRHPATGKKVGYRIVTLGTMEVTGTDSEGLVVAKIMETFDAVSRGDLVTPKEDIPEYISFKASDSQLSGYIVAGRELRVTFGQGDVVYLDMGTNQGVETGNTFIVYREGKTVKDKMSKRRYKLPTTTVGRLLVLHPKKDSSIAIILDSAEEMKLGETIKIEQKKD
ncbi:MAG: LysM peptidoglycan-binding domain-containing protein [Proteobacteria bacterium]|nr:LysM peptidoglycan-binding domain-containing protein [Pseudomonadota bacterium]